MMFNYSVNIIKKGDIKKLFGNYFEKTLGSLLNQTAMRPTSCHLGSGGRFGKIATSPYSHLAKKI
jgi:hypothetical protein